MGKTTKKKALLPFVLLASLGLAGCSTDGYQQVKITNHFRGLAVSNSTASSSDAVPAAYWSNGDRKEVALSTYGSSSCPLYPVEVEVVSSTAVNLKLRDYAGACTADLAPYTSQFVLPDSVSRKQNVKISIEQGSGSNTLLTNLTLRPSPTAKLR